MASNVTTSLVVQFTSSGGGSLSAEIDSRPDGLNDGKTSFAPGDRAGFLVFKSDDVTLDSVQSSAGVLSSFGETLYEVKDEWVQFLDSKEATPAKPITSNLEYRWYGNNLGTVSVVGGKLVAQSSGVGMLKVSYKSKCLAYSLSSPSSLSGSSEFQVAVLVKGHN